MQDTGVSCRLIVHICPTLQDAVSITKQGTLAITASRGRTVAPFSALWGDQRAEVPYKSGMVQVGHAMGRAQGA